MTEPVAVQFPAEGGLLFAAPGGQRIYHLSNTGAPEMSSELDRAVLRAYLTLALERLGRQAEEPPHARPRQDRT